MVPWHLTNTENRGMEAMGCLNSTGSFKHWFSNIHFSGPCNRSCYFCIGQHMMALDSYNNLDKWPLDGIEEFVSECNNRGVSEVNLTGSNTDPMLYKHLVELNQYLSAKIPNMRLGLRTNGIIPAERLGLLSMFTHEVSVSVHSFDRLIYKQMMGQGEPPDIKALMRNSPAGFKVNIVLSPFNIDNGDLFDTLGYLVKLGVPKINIREPYGQPHVGNPLELQPPDFMRFNMPVYVMDRTEVMYWDVHYVEVESVNLYANGVVSMTYPVTKGHVPNNAGQVRDQSNWREHKRHVQQWAGGS